MHTVTSYMVVMASVQIYTITAPEGNDGGGMFQVVFSFAYFYVHLYLNVLQTIHLFLLKHLRI